MQIDELLKNHFSGYALGCVRWLKKPRRREGIISGFSVVVGTESEVSPPNHSTKKMWLTQLKDFQYTGVDGDIP